MQKLLFIYILATLVACGNDTTQTKENWQRYQQVKQIIALEEDHIHQTLEEISKSRFSYFMHQSHGLSVHQKLRACYQSTRKNIQKIEQEWLNDEQVMPSVNTLQDKESIAKWIEDGKAQALVDTLIMNMEKARNEFTIFFEALPYLRDEERKAVMDVHEIEYTARLDKFISMKNGGEYVAMFSLRDIKDKSVGEVLLQLAIWEEHQLLYLSYLHNSVLGYTSGRSIPSGPDLVFAAIPDVPYDLKHKKGKTDTIDIYIRDSDWEDYYDSIRYVIDGQEVARSEVFEYYNSDTLTVSIEDVKGGLYTEDIYMQTHHIYTGWRDEGTQHFTYKTQ